MEKVIRKLKNNKLIEKLWKIRREGNFSDFNEEDLYSEKELHLLKT